MREAKKINDVSEDKLIEYTDTMVRLISNCKLEMEKSDNKKCYFTAASVRFEQGWSFATIGNGKV